MNFAEIVHKLEDKKQKIATMESCTGGLLASTITNIPGASTVFEYGAVTYSNAYKIKMGVPKEIIDTYTVYSTEVARAMAKAIADFSASDYGIGITGKLNREDPNNLTGNDSMVYFSIYRKETDTYIDQTMSIMPGDREEMKKQILRVVCFVLEKNI